MKLYKNLLYFGNVPSYSKWLNLVRVLLTLKSFRSSMTSSDEETDSKPIIIIIIIFMLHLHVFVSHSNNV